MNETIDVLQVRDGKFHRPINREVGRDVFRCEHKTACGRNVTPINVFTSVEDALSYCGERKEFMCSQCYPKDA